jgi:type IV pilus assembly protein PilX
LRYETEPDKAMTHPVKHVGEFKGPRSQQGVVLIVALMMVLMLTLLGVTISRLQLVEDRISTNDQNRTVASENTEAVLRYAECSLQGGCGGATWSNSSFAQNTAGLFELDLTLGSLATAASPDVALAGATWASPAGATLAYAGPALQTGSTPPQFLIEKLPALILPGDSTRQEQYNGVGGSSPYQITAFAVGADNTSRAVLQSVFRP